MPGAGGSPFARLLANLLVMGSGVLGRAFVQAYKQALSGGGKVATEAASKAVKGGVVEHEARQILNVSKKATAEEVTEAHERLVAMNDPAKGGSAYLQSRVTNAKTSLLGHMGVAPAEEAPLGDAKPGAAADGAQASAKADAKADAGAEKK